MTRDARDAIVDAAARYEMPAYPRIDVVAARGEGASLFDLDGTEYLDLYGGHAVALLGHSPKRVVDAITEQARELLFYSNVVHAPSRARASGRLCRLAPWDDAKVFFVNSGAEANETALKIARKATGRTRIVSYEGGFHGRSLGVLGACGLGSYREQSAGLVNDYVIAPFGDLEAIDTDTAAVLVEPIQSMGGMRVLPNAAAIRSRCDDVGALLIFDEVQTAPARTGYWFAGERWDVQPDLITTAKGIAAGFPAGVVLGPARIAETMQAGDQGTTFGGAHLACAAIDATLAELEAIDAPQRAQAIETRVRAGLDAEVLGHGALLGVRVSGSGAVAALRDQRVLVGGCPGDTSVIRLFPPVNITDDELDRGIRAIRSVCEVRA